MKAKFLVIITLLIVSSIPVVTCSKPSFTPPPSEIEATEFMGAKLTPISEQLNNALAGTPIIDRETYRLTVKELKRVQRILL